MAYDDLPHLERWVGQIRARPAVQAGILQGSLYEPANITLVHHANQALRAHKLFQRDKDYIVKDNQIVIIDEFTGRMMPGRRYSEGLHQALEAKEGVQVQPENVTLASITFQNYFRLYKKLAGMTGTASTEADEFAEIYNLDCVEIPTNRPVQRIDEDDEVYRTGPEKLKAIVREIEAASQKMQPILVGTTSIEKSEQLAEFLISQGYKQIDFSQASALQKLYVGARAGKPSKLFAVLNARFHEQEAYIVAEAGVPGAVTIATNMAGRGTDIVLGGSLKAELGEVDPADTAARAAIEADWKQRHEQVVAAGGLHIIGTERHESRRIDNQLRGRSGRQGDPGSSRFYLSLDDPLMRIFAGDRVRAKNIHPATHTRLPRYVRGQVGTVQAVRGVHVLPDHHTAHPPTATSDQGEWLYTVVFDARDLWGTQADPTVSVSVDAWESYLEPEALA